MFTTRVTIALMKHNTKNPIKSIREQLGLTQGQMAKGIGFRRETTVSNYENGYRTPDPRTAYKIIKLADSKNIKITLEDIYPPDIYTKI